MPLVEPTDLLLVKVLGNCKDGVLLQVVHLPGVYESTILFDALPAFACKVYTHCIGHAIGEDVVGLYVKLSEEKHFHVRNIALGRISNSHATNLLRALVCCSLRVALWGSSKLTLSSIASTQAWIFGGARGSIGKGIVREGTFCIVHGVDTVLVNVSLANNDGRVC